MGLQRVVMLRYGIDDIRLFMGADLRFLQEVLTDAKNAHPLIADHPELGALASKLTTLYREITEAALANEKAG